ncbi:hypothetical protein [Massilia timonae]|uniref:hypothetical protein n=1 Tax=Massilia timonae TaxID=47229 RepID=UPI0028D2BE27|nr:hypothetical protein [Massilia timonae]
MNSPLKQIFSTRPTVILELPLKKGIRILHPEQVILKIGPSYCDLGAFCYSARACYRKENGKPRDVVLASLLKHRPRQILQLIKALSSLLTDTGLRLATVKSHETYFKSFLDWADSNGFHDCLAGGEGTGRAYGVWVEESEERYRRGDFNEGSYNNRIRIAQLLQVVTGSEQLTLRIVKRKRQRRASGVTEPLSPHDFAHAVALNQALFDGLCELVVEHRPFPYKLILPATLGWVQNFLWLFPTHMWRLPPHKWGTEREKLSNTCWPYNYAEGCLATPEEIAHRYARGGPNSQLKYAKFCIGNAAARIDSANGNNRDWVRRMLGMVAHNAFLFLFFCNTGANESVARGIETDGQIDPTTLNQKYRSIKFRAGKKTVTLVVPVTFMPTLRRFMELRKYLLDDNEFPYLFFTLGKRTKKQSAQQIGSGALESLYTNVLRFIDPLLPRMASRKIRASVSDWYQRHNDASVTAKVLQNSERTTQAHYDAGSATDHHEEMSLYLECVSDSAKRQRVISSTVATDNRLLEEGGGCDSFGDPEALGDNVPVKPNCRDSQGCLFCVHRVLVACEEDARKVASAAFVMEQVILGPKHEEAIRPMIDKCYQDLEKIAAFDNCRSLVEDVRIDVFENGNLTPFFADKYHLFLELGVTV